MAAQEKDAAEGPRPSRQPIGPGDFQQAWGRTSLFFIAARVRGVPRAMQKIYEGLFIAALVLAVAAFGGTEPLAFSVVQVVLLGLGVLLLLRGGMEGSAARFSLVIPLALLGIVLFQLIGLPTWILQSLHDHASLLPGHAFAKVSVAPHETQLELLRWMAYWAAFYLVLRFYRTPRACARLVAALIALGSLEAFWGVAQFLTGWHPLRTYVAEGHPIGTYVNRNHFAGLLAMVFPFALGRAMVSGQQALEVASPAKPGFLRRVFSGGEEQPFVLWLSLSAVVFLGIVSSLSRMGILATLFATLVVSLLVAAASRRWSASGLVFLGFCVAAFALAAWIGIQPVVARFEEPLAGRLGIWRDTLELIGRSPLVGVGLGAYPVAVTSVQTAYPAKMLAHAHNDYLEFAADLGVPGALLLFSAVVYVLLQAARAVVQCRAGFPTAIGLGCVGGLTAVLIHSATDFNLHIPGNALVFSTLLGLACVITFEGRTEQEMGA